MYISFIRIVKRVVRCCFRHRSFSLAFFAGFLFFLFCLVTLFFTSPLERTYHPQVFSIDKGSSVRAVADDLRDRGIINSPSLFILSNYIVGNSIVWGSYNLSRPRGVFSYALDLHVGNKNIPPIKIVIPERSDVYAIADIFEREVKDFDRTGFIDVALERHGYLYPDTYLFAGDYAAPEYFVEIMSENFSQRTDDLFSSYQGDLSRDEIVTLASIVDLEASRYEDRRKIAGVLFNRLELNMPLQVDVSFLFIEGKNTFQLSREDLNSDDPSNTYRYRGIPPIPITNPSRESVEAVLNPIESDHLFFLADFYGNTYYSKTYDEHLIKRQRYIKNKEPPPGFSPPVSQDLADDVSSGSVDAEGGGVRGVSPDTADVAGSGAGGIATDEGVIGGEEGEQEEDVSETEGSSSQRVFHSGAVLMR